MRGGEGVDERAVCGRLRVATLVVYVAFVIAMTVGHGMLESWSPLGVITVVTVMVVTALVFVLVARVVAGPGRHSLPVRRNAGFGPWNLLLACCNGAVGIGTLA